MAVNNSTSAFVQSLNPSQRNQLRLIVTRESSLKDLNLMLGQKAEPITELEYRLGLARTGRTIELFPQQVRVHKAANINEVL